MEGGREGRVEEERVGERQGVRAATLSRGVDALLELSVSERCVGI